MRWILPGIAVLLLDVAGAWASQLYTDRAAFNAASYNRQTIDFEGLADPEFGLMWFIDASGLTQKGVNFTGPSPWDYYLFVMEPSFTPELYDWGSGAVLLGPAFGGDSQIRVLLPPGVTAVGSDIMTIVPDGASFDVTLSTGETFTVGTNSFPNRAFVGFTSDVPITSLSFVAEGGAFPLLDNFTFGQVAPMPPSLVLFLTGAGSLAAYRWRRRYGLTVS